MEINFQEKYRLRSSVSFVPINISNGIYEFFISNTRKKITLKINEVELVNFILLLNGESLLSDIIKQFNNGIKIKIPKLVDYLISKNLIEPLSIVQQIQKHPFRRTLNFLADYIPYFELEDAWNNILNCHVVIFGVGAMGSWISTLLVQMGIQNFTLIDEDIVKLNNLNRSLFKKKQVGKSKINSLYENLLEKNNNINISLVCKSISTSIDVDKIISNLEMNNVLIINCADFPNVDYTSRIIGEVCFKYKIPYIISGGYNLHLSLIGLTVIPNESACFECSRLFLEELNSTETKGLIKLKREQRNIGSIVPLSAISASFVANEVIRISARSNYLKPAMTNRRGEYNFITNEVKFVNFEKHNQCYLCNNL